ncbi:TonB family protein [Rhizobium sp. RU36D]|uniref:TonB family protein n=1 Tax=Rhizobium sp. RU36D TaxID=1907415 RepID=UPI0009D914C7|nr:TonB family protein [Rhizobium sp. RU36D]SMD01713.1 protein TonB [Rhizobium sp. RU36D]
MSTSDGFRRSRAARIGEVALWSSAALVVFAAHAYAVALMLQEPEAVMADDSPPAAIMIELAPEPEAVIVEEQQITSDVVESEEVQSAAIEPLPQPIMELPPEPPVIPPPEMAEPVIEPDPEPVTESVPEPMPEPLMELPPEAPVIPPPDIAEPIEEIEPIEEQVTAALENVEVPLPIMRPPPPEPQKVPEKKVEKKKPEKKVAKKPPPPPPASKAAQVAKAEVQQSNRTAAQQTSAGRGSSMKPADWKAKVSAHIRRRVKSVNKNIRDSVTVTISFSYDGAGNITSVAAKSSTGDSDLNAAAVSIIHRSSPLPVPPNGGGSFTQAFVFK